MRIIIAAALAGLVTLAILPEPAQGETFDVTVGPGGAFVFEPAMSTIDIGDLVRWTWDSGGHNVGSGLPGAPTAAFLSGPPAGAGTTFEVLFDQAFLDAFPEPGNVYDYHCHPHGDLGMVGSVTVLPEPGTVGLLGVAALLLLRRRGL